MKPTSLPVEPDLFILVQAQLTNDTPEILLSFDFDIIII
jgi:hypothetical protein